MLPVDKINVKGGKNFLFREQRYISATFGAKKMQGKKLHEEIKLEE